MRIPGVSRLGKLGKLGLVLIILGFVGGMILTSLARSGGLPVNYTSNPRVSGREVIRNSELLNRAINGMQIRVVANPNQPDIWYSIGIVPSDLTANVRNNEDFREYAVAWVEGQGSHELTHDQLGGATAFDIVIFCPDEITLGLTVSYDVAAGALSAPFIIVGAILIVLGIALDFLSKRRIKIPFVEGYYPEVPGEPEQPTTRRFVDEGAEGEYAFERVTARSMPQEPETIEPPEETETCPFCGGTVSKSAAFCPTCYSELL